MRRVSDGRTSRRLRTTVSAHHVVFPSSLPPPFRPSVSPRLSGFTLCLVFLFFSLCLPSVVVSHRSLSPLLSPLSRTFTRPCLFQQLYLHLQHCCTCSAELSVARTKSECRFASVSGSNFASDFVSAKMRLLLVRRGR